MNNLWEAFAFTARRVPARASIIADDRSYGFSDLATRAQDFRHVYRTSGVQPGDRILLWMENSFNMAAALAACWGEDAVAVLMDSGCKAPQLTHALQLVQPRLVVHVDPNWEHLSEGNIHSVYGDAVPKTAESIKTDPSALPTDPASIVFTSGSTGMPKGVVQSHRNIYQGCSTVFRYLGLRDDDVLLCPVPWSFDYGYGQLLFCLLRGITQVIPRINNPFGICESIERSRPTVLAGTASIFAYLMGGMSPVGETDLTSIQKVTNTGGKLARPVLDLILDVMPQSEVILNYGLTETYRSCYLPPNLTRVCPDALGIPIPGVGIAVVHPDGSKAAPFEEGEIVHRGSLICLGYWGNPEATAKAIRRDPFAHSDLTSDSRALFTGDIGYMDDRGLCFYVGRRDRLLKSMGVRVSPNEVEDNLLESGLLAFAAVIGLPHEVLGHEVNAIVVPKDPEQFDLRRLEKYARSQMSQYMLPRRYHTLDALPLTSSGKTDYIALERYASGRAGSL